MSDLLNVQNLTLATSENVLVDNLSFSIKPGERFGLIGESGSGKSLTSLAIIGLLSSGIHAKGSINLTGNEIIAAPEKRLVKMRGDAVATVFQEPLTALDPLMPLGRQIAGPVRRRLKRMEKDTSRAAVTHEVHALLEQVRLPEPERMMDAFPHEVSGGQRQRVAIAMALACQPRLLIADEPTTALDVTTQAEIVRLITTLVDELGITLLFISHDLAVVGQVAERVMVMRDGRAIEIGLTQQVLTRPEDAYTKSLVAAARRFDYALEGKS